MFDHHHSHVTTQPVFNHLFLSRSHGRETSLLLVSAAITPGSLSLETSGRAGQKTQILLANPAFFPHIHPHSPPPSFLSITVPVCQLPISRKSSYIGSSWAPRQNLRNIPYQATHSHNTFLRLERATESKKQEPQQTSPDTDTRITIIPIPDV